MEQEWLEVKQQWFPREDTVENAAYDLRTPGTQNLTAFQFVIFSLIQNGSFKILIQHLQVYSRKNGRVLDLLGLTLKRTSAMNPHQHIKKSIVPRVLAEHFL